MTVNEPEREIIYYTSEELAERFRTRLSTIRYWRQIGTGPAGTRIGRRVLYAADDVAAWEATRRHPPVT
jgi:DNA-binding transcriptional MerR regulator